MFIINALTGELCHRLGGPFLPGPLAVDFSRAYTSSSSYVSPLGFGWTAPYDVRLVRKGSQLLLYHSNDELDRFDSPVEPGHMVEGNQHSLRYHDEKRWSIEHKAKKLVYELNKIGGTVFLTRVKDTYGNALDLNRDTFGRIVALTDSVGRQLSFSYQGSLVTKIQLARHGSEEVGHLLLQCEYDSEGRLLWTSNGRDPRSTYAYHMGRLVAYSNPLGGRCCARYDGDGRCVQVWEQQGQFSRSFAYDRVRMTTKVVDSFGYSTLYRFDEQGNLKEKVDALAGVTTYVRDDKGRVIAEFNPAGDPSVVYQADEGGNRVTKTSANGASTTLEFGPNGEVVAVVDATGGRWKYERDSHGKIGGLTSAMGRTWKFAYDRKGRFRRIAGPGDWELEHSWTDDGRQYTLSDRLGTLAKKQFDALGRIVAFRGQRGAAFSVQYSGTEQVVENVDGSTRQHEMDAMGNVIRFVDELGSTVRFRYDQYGRLLAMSDPMGAQVMWEYDAEGRVKSVTNANGELLENTRDPLGRIVGQTGFAGSKRQYTYDAAGRLLSRIDGNGVALTITPDGIGQPNVRSYSDGYVVETEYGIGERLARASDEAGTLEFEYDAEYRTTTERYESSEINYEYDWHSSPSDLRCNRRHLRFKYDQRGALSQLAEGEDFLLSLERDPDLLWENLVFQTGLRIRREFDARGRLVAQEVDARGGAELFSISYSYDARGNRIETRRSGREPLSFSHNARGELNRVYRGGTLIREYAYDAAGNQIQGGVGFVEVGPGNQASLAGSRKYEYDGEGRPVRELEGDHDRTFRYDARGRLIEIGSVDLDSIEFSYDFLFRRTRKQLRDREEVTIWAGDAVLEQHLADGSRLEYVMHPVHRTPLAVRINGNWHAVVCDQRGEMTDVVCLLDEKVVWSSDVLGFEWDVREGDSAFPVPIRGSGQMFDDETGYCYQRARYYDPSIGRFLMPDPIGFYGGLNVYQFCLNQPFLFTDPLGLAACPLSEDDCNDIFKSTLLVSFNRKFKAVPTPPSIAIIKSSLHPINAGIYPPAGCIAVLTKSAKKLFAVVADVVIFAFCITIPLSILFPSVF